MRDRDLVSIPISTPSINSYFESLHTVLSYTECVPVPLQVLAHRHGLLDQAVQILGHSRGGTCREGEGEAERQGGRGGGRAWRTGRREIQRETGAQNARGAEDKKKSGRSHFLQGGEVQRSPATPVHACARKSCLRYVVRHVCVISYLP